MRVPYLPAYHAQLLSTLQRISVRITFPPSAWCLSNRRKTELMPRSWFIGEHYRSDHHRYNMKRRVVGLPPVSIQIFNDKVLERKAETAIMASAKGSVCEVCR